MIPKLTDSVQGFAPGKVGSCTFVLKIANVPGGATFSSSLLLSSLELSDTKVYEP